MKLCIDGFCLSYLKGTGCYTYLYGLCSTLFFLYPQPEYTLIWNHESGIPQWNQYQNVKYLDIDVNRKANNYSQLEEYLKESKTDLYFSIHNGFSLPERKVCKNIIAVQDLAPLSIYNMVDYAYSTKFISIFPEVIRKADKILAVSEYIKNEIIRNYHIPEQKIEVIYPCCLEIFRPMDPMEARNYLYRTYHITGEFILYAGSIHERKNFDQLIQAFYMLSRERNQIKLVITGDFDHKRKMYYAQIKKIIQDFNLQEKVIFTGVVELEDMPYFYNCASCTVNISSYEGYPLTAVEAASCLTPVICLHNTSFDEIQIPTAIFLETLDASHLRDTLLLAVDKKKKDYVSKQNTNVYTQSAQSNIGKKLVRIIESVVYGD